MQSRAGVTEHFVQFYQEPARLADTVSAYVRDDLARGEAVVIIARPELVQHLHAQRAKGGELRLLDAEDTLSRFMTGSMPSWSQFQALIGGLIGDLRARYPALRAYGDMVDVLWQRGEREAAIRLEEYWNELGRLHAFSLFCAYHLDPLAVEHYGGELESICSVHPRLLPFAERPNLDEEVRVATRKVLDQPLAELLLSLAVRQRAQTEMSVGQATLFWLRQNMPRSAERILSELRASAP